MTDLEISHAYLSSLASGVMEEMSVEMAKDCAANSLEAHRRALSLSAAAQQLVALSEALKLVCNIAAPPQAKH